MVEAIGRERRQPRGRYGAGAYRAGYGRRVRRAGGLAAVCAAAVLTAGCGGSGAAAERTAGAAGAGGTTSSTAGTSNGNSNSNISSNSTGADAKAPARTVTGAADALLRAGSSHVSTALRTPSGGTWLTITGTGRFDYARGRGEIVLTLPADPGGAIRHKPITELFMPGALYMKDRGAGVPDGKWVRVDTTRLADGNLVTGGATDPLAAAELLRGARQVTYVGAERVAGVAVRHYRGTADIAVAAKGASAGERGALGAAAKGFADTAVPFDAWLDGAGRLRQLVERFSFGADGTPRDGGSVTVVSTTRYGRFGTPVVVALPHGADIWTGKIASSR